MSVLDMVDDLLAYLKPSERRELDEHVAHLRPLPKGKPVPKGWRQRVRTLFPKYAYNAFARRHEEFWEWEDAITVDGTPDPFVAIWPRGGAKSSSAEMAAVDLGCAGKRKYCLYVRSTQLQADKSVANIASLLESDEIARHFPEHADRAVGKFGNAKGWRREQLRTKGGFTVDALGLDTASRGVKVDEQRPDIIIFDDIDDKLDGPHITAKKLATITHSILPAGAKNCAVLMIQNLIIPDGIFTQLSDGRADFLVRRRVSGPFPAVENLKVEWQSDDVTGLKRAVIVGGTATWEGQDLAACQGFIDTWGLTAFMKEAQHKVKERGEAVALRLKPSHYVDLDDDQCRELVKRGRPFGGIDFGAWRFGFTLWSIDSNRVPYRIDEYFSQNDNLSTRARFIHEMCEYYGITGMMPIWGDAANPQDIMELNEAFRRGWEETPGKWVKSKLRVVRVMNENKARKVSVTRINDALDRNALRFRRDISYEWRYAMGSGSEGTSMTGSRLMWEIDAWSYPAQVPGEAQEQDPDDDTADGADMVASMRYALMSHWKAAKTPLDHGTYENDRAEPFDYKARKFKEIPHAVDPLITGNAGRRTPRVNAPRPRIGR